MESVWEAAVMQSAMNYIRRQQAAVTQWVVLRPIFKGCTGEKGYEGGGFWRDAWWRQEVVHRKLWEILAEVREARRKR